MKGNLKNQWEQAKKDSELEYRKKHIKNSNQSKQEKGKYRNSKTHKMVLIFTYMITLPFLGLVIGGDIGWFIAGFIGFLGLFAVLKR